MKTLDQGKDKIKKICDELRSEIIVPAKQDAQEILADAKRQAAAIIAEAHKQADAIREQNRKDLEQERNVFNSSLQQGTRQSLEALKQAIEHEFFHDGLDKILDKQVSDPKVVANLINAIIKGIEAEGLSSDLSALIGRTASPREINELITAEVVKKLREKTVLVGDFAGGAQIRMNDRKMTVEITDQALKELFANYVRKDFRKLIFAN